MSSMHNPPEPSITNTPRGFVAGTLVHTKEGLKPIEQIRVGDMVLSQPEMKGELAYKKVINIFVYEDEEIYLVDFCATKNSFNSREQFDYETFWEEEEQLHKSHLIVTGNHLFWVKGFGWTRVEYLPSYISGTNVLETKDGFSGVVLNVRKIFRTEENEIGWAYERNEAHAPTIDLRKKFIVVSTEDTLDPYFTSEPTNSSVNRDIKRRVYNFEVEDFHTYYVGELGVWVNCGGVCAI